MLRYLSTQQSTNNCKISLSHDDGRTDFGMSLSNVLYSTKSRKAERHAYTLTLNVCSSFRHH